MRTAGVVLAGGRSTRMGRDKATVAWRDATLLDHVVGVLADAVDGPLVVVGAADRPAPVVRDDVVVGAPGRLRVVADPRPGGGPLLGLATGLTAARTAGADVAFVASVDLPLLHPAYVGAVLARLGAGDEVALPVIHGHRQPLAAAYATALGPRATALIDAGATRPGELFAASTVRELTPADLLAGPDGAVLAAHDPHLDAVLGANTPAELAALRRRDGGPDVAPSAP